MYSLLSIHHIGRTENVMDEIDKIMKSPYSLQIDGII